MARFCVGIDLGGTFIKCALLDEAMSIRGELSSPTPAEKGPEAVIEAMASGAERLIRQQGLSPQQIARVLIAIIGFLRS